MWKIEPVPVAKTVPCACGRWPSIGRGTCAQRGTAPGGPGAGCTRTWARDRARAAPRCRTGRTASPRRRRSSSGSARSRSSTRCYRSSLLQASVQTAGSEVCEDFLDFVSSIDKLSKQISQVLTITKKTYSHPMFSSFSLNLHNIYAILQKFSIRTNYPNVSIKKIPCSSDFPSILTIFMLFYPKLSTVYPNNNIKQSIKSLKLSSSSYLSQNFLELKHNF